MPRGRQAVDARQRARILAWVRAGGHLLAEAELPGVPDGLLDAAGQVYEWTTTPAGAGRFIVKGGSWDDKGCGVCRPAARHARPTELRHIIIGFRLVRDP